MGCAQGSFGVAARDRKIRLLLAGYLIEKKKRPQLAEHVLGILQANASSMPRPQAIEVIDSEVVDNPGVRLGNGEVVANISYRVVS